MLGWEIFLSRVFLSPSGLRRQPPRQREALFWPPLSRGLSPQATGGEIHRAVKNIPSLLDNLPILMLP